MSGKSNAPGNILVNPSSYADRLEQLDLQTDHAEIDRIEQHLAHRLRLGGAITYIDEDGNHVIEDRNGIRPFIEGADIPPAPPSAELEIRELAFQHGVHGNMTLLDEWCEAVSANAGDEIQSDEIELLIIGLRRVSNVDGVHLTKLHAQYLEELKTSS